MPHALLCRRSHLAENRTLCLRISRVPGTGRPERARPSDRSVAQKRKCASAGRGGTHGALSLHMPDLSLAVLAGGRSPAHDLSLDSAYALLKALEGSRWSATLVAVNASGEFPMTDPVAALRSFDYVLPLVRGGQGEGLLGLLDAFEVPVLGERPTAAAVALDKPLAKRLLREAGLPVLGHVVVQRRHLAASPREICGRIARDVGFPCFVKPASGVASAGAGVVWDARELAPALFRAAARDARILVEPFLDAREIEVAVIGGVPSFPGELVYRAEHHDYATKCAADKLELVIPALVDETERERLRTLAVSASSALGIEVVGRVEILRDRNTRELFVNEVNAAPAFQAAAPFSRLWEASGLSPAGVVDRLAAACDARVRDRFRTRSAPALP